MNMHDRMTGAELQTLREAAGLSREGLGKLAHVEARTVKHWETRAGASVPGDVAQMVNEAARWICSSARQALDQVQAMAVQHGSAAEVVLLRYRESAHMHASERAAGISCEMHAAMLARVLLGLLEAGHCGRVVWFDPPSYDAWRTMQRAGTEDTPADRSTWATVAMDLQAAIPHPSDQPPPGHTPTR